MLVFELFRVVEILVPGRSLKAEQHFVGFTRRNFGPYGVLSRERIKDVGMTRTKVQFTQFRPLRSFFAGVNNHLSAEFQSNPA